MDVGLRIGVLGDVRESGKLDEVWRQVRLVYCCMAMSLGCSN
jgi:hypothetical protein